LLKPKRIEQKYQVAGEYLNKILYKNIF